MAKNATLAIRIVSDAKGATAGFAEAESKTAKFQRGLDKASVAAAGVVAGIGAVAKEAYEAASAAQQSAGAIESVFGKEAAAIQKLSEGAAQAVGLSANAYREQASVLGAGLKGVGYAGKELTGTTDTLIRTGADLAATFGGTTSDAVSALSSLMRGERDPIERYGITLNQAAVDAKVAALGLDTSTAAAKKHAETQATLALVAEKSGGAQGAFARELDTAAGSTAVASAQFEDAKAALGEVLLPVVTVAMEKLAGLAGWMKRNKDVIIPLIGVVAGLATAVLAINGAIRTYTAMAKAARAAQIVWNIAMSLNPIMLIVLAIAAVIAAVVLAYKKFSWFRGIVDSIGDALAWAFDKAKSAISWVVDKLSWIGGAAGWVSDLFSASGTVAVTPVAAGSVAGMFGSSAGAAAAVTPVAAGSVAGMFGSSAGAAAAPAGVFGAPMSGLAGGGPTAGQASRPTVNVTMNVGVGDPVELGRQLERILRRYAEATGSSVALTVGGR